VVDPKKRANLTSVLKHRWVTSGPITPHHALEKEKKDGIDTASTSVANKVSPIMGYLPKGISSVLQSSSSSHGFPLPLYLPDRLRLIIVDPAIVLGICMALRQQYSPALLSRLLEHMLLDWDTFSTHPLIRLYYLVEEKVARYRIDRDAQRYLPHYKSG